jgi:SPP1 gp7 family putative phage head morphogenesis protein
VAERPTREELRRRQRRFLRGRGAEGQFAAALRRIARQIGALTNGIVGAEPDPNQIAELVRTLEGYSRLIGPWAEATAARVLAEIDRRDAAAWSEHGREIGRALRREIASAPTGPVLARLLDEQVHLIKSLPLEAAQRVQGLAQEAMLGGRRWSEVAADIRATGQVGYSRANTIARTETARVSSLLSETRAVHVGSPGYIWRTARDREVRPRHRRLEGQFIRWDSPPVAGERGERAHAGQIYNCRCFAEVVLPALEEVA